LLALIMASAAAAQDVPSDDDLFRDQPVAEPSTEPPPAGPDTTGVTAARLVRVIRDAKILYEDRKRKIVYDCKLYSDDSRVFHGSFVEFYRNGKQFCSGQYRDGRRHGKWTFLRPDGSVAKEGEYVDDRPTGKWRYLRADGNVSREEMYKDGLPHGPWVTFGQDGKTPVYEIEFAEGKLVERESS
jgi:antitoxin component YwqK of YwqJK toxin-antitoxin module